MRFLYVSFTLLQLSFRSSSVFFRSLNSSSAFLNLTPVSLLQCFKPLQLFFSVFELSLSLSAPLHPSLALLALLQYSLSFSVLFPSMVFSSHSSFFSTPSALLSTPSSFLVSPALLCPAI